MKPNVGHVAALLTACLLGSSVGCQSVQIGGLDMLTSPLSRSFSAIKDAATVNTDQHPDPVSYTHLTLQTIYSV